jgi:hypothetical protein
LLPTSTRPDGSSRCSPRPRADGARGRAGLGAGAGCLSASSSPPKRHSSPTPPLCPARTPSLPPLRGAPLYLGQLRSRPPASYSALLAFRPDKPGAGAAAVIGSNLSGREPRYSLLAEGQIITLDQRDGAFHSLLLWLSYHQTKRQGLLGGRYLAEYAGLEAVIAPGGPLPSVPQRVWSWWFPS